MDTWWDLATSGRGAWAREARRAMAAATERRVSLQPEQLIFCDVRDLQALVIQLRGRRQFLQRKAAPGRPVTLPL